MTSKRRLLPLLAALLIWGSLNSTHASSESPEAASAASSSSSSSESPKSSAPSGVMIDEAGSRKKSSSGAGYGPGARDPPGSPVNLFTPDEFQFYTLNGNGQLVMKQMSKQEIQGMIAAGGGTGGLPVDLGHHQSQMPIGEPKVADVIQNVQNVLKGELKKPVQVPATATSIPGSVNSQWTNMLPYILSGGSADQQDIAQDTSIILPAIDDQSYIDVVPLQDNKPDEGQYDSGPNYAPVQSNFYKPISNKFSTFRPTLGANDKPIYLLGNMALDSGILGGQETFTVPAKKRPSRPTTASVYQKFTTTRPNLAPVIKDTATNLKNSSNNKPTLYISVSPSLLADSQKPESYGQLGSIDIHKSGYTSRPSQENKNRTQSPDSSAELLTTSSPSKKVPVYIHTDEPEIKTSIQHINQQQTYALTATTPMLPMPSTLPSLFLTSTDVKETPYPSKINVGLMGGFKKPGLSHRPSTSYRPVYEPTSRPSTVSLMSSSRPVYEAASKPSTAGFSTSSYKPTYKPVLQTNTVKMSSRPTYEQGIKVSTVAVKTTPSRRPVYDYSTTPSEEFKITLYPGDTYQTYFTGKASPPVLEIVTKPSTQAEGLKVTKYPSTAHQTYSTVKGSSPEIESVTKSSTQNKDSELIKGIQSQQETSTNNKEIVNVNKQTPSYESYPSTLSESKQSAENADITNQLPEGTTDSSGINKNQYYTTVPVKSEDENETPVTVYNTSRKPIQYQTADVTLSQEQSTTKTDEYATDEDSSVFPVMTTLPEESSLENNNEYYTTSVPKYQTKETEMPFAKTDNTLIEVTETTIPGDERNSVKIAQTIPVEEFWSTDKQPDGIPTAFVTKADQAQAWNEREQTTQFGSQDEATINYNTVKYDFENTKRTSEYADSTIDYTTPILINGEDKTDYPRDSLTENKTTKPASLSTNPLKDNYQPIMVTPAISIPTSDEIELEQPEHRDIETIKSNSINKSTLQYPVTTESPTTVTQIYENSETITENVPFPEANVADIIAQTKQDEIKQINQLNLPVTKLSIEFDKNKVPVQEEDASTVKVIPVYDDDTSIYNLSPNSQNRGTTPTSIASIQLSELSKPEYSTEKSHGEIKSPNESFIKTTQSVKPVDKLQPAPANQPNYSSKSDLGQVSAPSGLSTSSISSSAIQSIINTALPGLHETFNNYMKEHYDPNLSPTGNYDDISHLTTFPTAINKDFASNGNKLPISSSVTSDYITTETPQYEINQETLQSNSKLTPIIPDYISTEPSDSIPSTTAYFSENTDKLKPEQKISSTSQNTEFKEIYSTEYYAGDKNTIFTTKLPLNKNSSETPIIYLDLASPGDNKQNASYQLNNDHMSNSSLTRIKIKNPVSEVDKIILEAPAQTNTPPTVYYTLPTGPYMDPNNIASGLIAGYPTYSQATPVTEFLPSTQSMKVTDDVSKPIPTKAPMQSKPQEYQSQVTQKEENMGYQGVPTTVVPTNNENYEDKTTIKSVINLQGGISTFNRQTLENPSFESTQPPSESLTVSNLKLPSQTEEKYDQMNSSFNPPLEKISDLINQLQNSPPEHDPVGYDFSNGIATTIVPLDKFETIINENMPTTNDDTLTTIFDKLSKISTESQNKTYVVLQTLPYTSQPYQSSTEPIHYTTVNEPSSTETTIRNDSKGTISSTATTILSIVKQPVTEKPLVTSTYSTTKASFEKIKSTIDKSAGRINLEEEKNKMQPMKPTEPPKFTMKNKIHYSSVRRPASEGYQTHTKKITKPVTKGTTATSTTTTRKPVAETKESNADKWTPPQNNIADQSNETKKPLANTKEGFQQPNPQIVTLEHATGAIGLDQSNKGLDKDVAEFLNMCNELSFKFWTLSNSGLSSSRSVTLSPFGMISTLAMIFLGARGLTSNQMNDILKLDDVVTFNPHLVFQNITDTVTLARGQGIENAAFVRELFADRLKVRRIMPFYKEQAQQFYEGSVVDINFSQTASEILKRRTNLLIRKQTGGRIKDFVKSHTVPLRSPLTALSANVFETSCDSPDASSEGRDGEMYFAVSQTVKQRKLVPIPAVVWKSGVSAGYEPSLDATAVALGDVKRPVSLIMIMPGQQGVTAPGDTLDRLEHRLFGNPSENALEKLLKVIVPRRVEVQMPKFSHRSVLNVTAALKKMGFDQLFTRTADLKGINGAGHDLFVADMLQMNLFCTCGDDNKSGGRHLSETYPGTSSRHNRAWEIINNVNNGVYDFLENNEPKSPETSERSTQCDDEEDTADWSGSENSSESTDDVEVLNQQLSQSGKWNLDRINSLREKMRKKRLRWFMPTGRRRCRNRRQAEPDRPRMKMDKPFLYLIRHNLTGLILYMGRFNPKNQS